MNANGRITRIENLFSKLLAKEKDADGKKIFPMVYLGKFPPALPKFETMVLIEVDKQNDYDAYVSGYVNVYLYAKPTGTNSKKNSKALDLMEERLNMALADYEDEDYSLEVQWSDSNYDEDREADYTVVNIGVISK